MRRLLAAGALTVIALLGGATPALAHNVLTGSDPADGASVAAGPREVRLTFDQPVREGEAYNTVTVVGPGGGHWEAGPAKVESNAVIVPLRELGPTGTYSVGYRVLSNDGHSVTGKVGFTLTTPGQGTPGPAVTTPPAAETGGMPVWPWLVAAVVVVAAGLVLALRLGKPKG